MRTYTTLAVNSTRTNESLVALATSLTNSKVWNCLVSQRGTVVGLKIGFTAEQRATVRKLYDAQYAPKPTPRKKRTTTK